MLGGVAYQQALDRGVLRGIDNVTTRTLTGSAYPKPGLFSKFRRRDEPAGRGRAGHGRPPRQLQPRLHRHYYEDQGYFGHANCSDNFTGRLAEHGLPPQKGWPAINLFFNTVVDAQSAIHFDEPWSRPGDYVLLRAMTDLVCASSACPCDIDAANGWVLTDIHVRVYPETNLFKRAVGFRMTPDAPLQLTKETGFHPRVAALTRDLVEYRGYWLPNSFAKAGPIEEYWACRELRCDRPLALAQVRGAWTRRRPCCAHAPQRPQAGGGPGGLLGHVLSAWRHDRRRDFVPPRSRPVSLDRRRRLWRDLAQGAGQGVWPRCSRSSQPPSRSTTSLGPALARDPAGRRLDPAGAPSVDELSWFRFTVARIGGYQGIPIVLSRTGYTGELGFEVFYPKDGPAVWDAIMQAGEPFGIAPMGLAALDMVRIEAGLVFSGYEFDSTTDPFEAGIGFAVAPKDEDWIGQDALARRKAHPKERLVGLELRATRLPARATRSSSAARRSVMSPAPPAHRS